MHHDLFFGDVKIVLCKDLLNFLYDDTCMNVFWFKVLVG
jgi:hypothetical protein